jgi:sugar-specific transcriptional regulator TrmB
MRQTLKQLNFSGKEIDVYLAALKLGSASITELAKRAKIKRPTTYVILEKLKEMGLISMSVRQKKRIFAVQKPDKLLKIIDLEKEKLNEKEKELKNILPELKSLTKKNTLVPIIKYYEGKEGVWNILDDLFESEQDTFMISTGKAYDVLGFKRIIKDVIEKRRKIGTTAYIISDHHPEQIKEYRKGKTLFRQYRFLPETIELDSIVYIYAGKIALVFFKEPLSGVIIENKELFQVFKFMFENLWKELEGKNLPE